MDNVLLIILASASLNAAAGYKDELRCMTVNAYHEARSEGKMGALMVMDTVMNRKASPLYPNTVCRVVYQKIQFSWTKNPPKVRNRAEYNRIKKLAVEVLAGKWLGISDGSMFYHARSITPYWAKSYVVTKTINNHKFYGLPEEKKE